MPPVTAADPVPGPPTTSTTVSINGFALREIRVRSGISVQQLADQLGLARSYITKIELGYSRRVSPPVFAALLSALVVGDRRALLAQPSVDTAPVLAP